MATGQKKKGVGKFIIFVAISKVMAIFAKGMHDLFNSQSLNVCPKANQASIQNLPTPFFIVF